MQCVPVKEPCSQIATFIVSANMFSSPLLLIHDMHVPVLSYLRFYMYVCKKKVSCNIIVNETK